MHRQNLGTAKPPKFLPLSEPCVFPVKAGLTARSERGRRQTAKPRLHLQFPTPSSERHALSLRHSSCPSPVLFWRLCRQSPTRDPCDEVTGFTYHFGRRQSEESRSASHFKNGLSRPEVGALQGFFGWQEPAPPATFHCRAAKFEKQVQETRLTQLFGIHIGLLVRKTLRFQVVRPARFRAKYKGSEPSLCPTVQAGFKAAFSPSRK